MRKVDTLKKNYEFSDVLKKGRYIKKKFITLYLNKNNLNKNVIGIAVNTKICNAVKRNKVKRIIREAYYLEKNNLKQGYNMVFLWNKKEPVDNIRFHIVHEELVEIFKEAGIIEKN